MENDPRNRRPNSPKGAPIGWTIKKSEAKAVLKEGVWTLDPENSSGSGPAYVSDQGELLLFSNTGKSVLYASRKDLMDSLEESRKRPPPTHVLEGLLPQGPHFIEAVPALIDELAAKLGLAREALDNSLESLDLVEKTIKAKIRPRKRILEIPNLFAAIVAYTGEVGRALTGGRWQLNEVHGGIWEPYVLFDNDNDYLNPFFETYRNIVERRYGGLMLVPLVVAHTSTRLKHV
jgi:hypothetical protein